MVGQATVFASFLAAALPLASVGGAARAAEQLAPVTIRGKVPVDEKAAAASEGLVPAEQIEARPTQRPADLLEAVPGLVVTQHSGDGKANQYFLRGFNLDHGTDVSIYALGMPVNQRTHAHGQGYADLNWLIPELVDSVAWRKGPYLARDGDFATAGAVEIDYVDRLDHPFALVGIGSHGWRRVLTAGSWPIGLKPGQRAADSDGRLLIAAEIVGYDGPWTVPENLRKQNLFMRYSEGSAERGWCLSAVAYQARWTATDQIPERAVAAGQLGRFDSLDSTTGGKTDLTALVWNARGDNRAGPWRANAYVSGYGLDLYSNFTYALDAAHGDQFRQFDRRTRWGADASQTWRWQAFGAAQSTTVGSQLRQDRIGALRLQLTDRREVYDTVRSDKVRETSIGVFIDQATQWTPWISSRAGLRADRFDFDVRADQIENSGTA
ncbi:MAG: TonB-dependent receptor plug domain-containing protein, partial [Burkholderiales bacterium]